MRFLGAPRGWTSHIRARLHAARLLRAVRTCAPWWRHLPVASGDRDHAKVNITVDLELAWGRSRRDDGELPRQERLSRARAARAAFSTFLGLCNDYGIPVTWAVVGHVVLGRCARDPVTRKPHASLPIFQPAWAESEWFGDDPCSSVEADPLWYGRDLICQIMASPVPHDFGSHSFSHVDFSDPACTPAIARAEVAGGLRALQEIGLDTQVFIFPKNRPAYLSILKDYGFRLFRRQAASPVGPPARDASGLVGIPHGIWVSPSYLTAQMLLRVLHGAGEQQAFVHLWFHLHEFGGQADGLTAFFEPVFEYLAGHREQIRVTPLGAIASQWDG